jgi:YegS/Rv2252/BmrU family lipid kinase
VKRVLIFANPIAGRGRGEAIANRVLRALRSGGFDARLWLAAPTDLTPADLESDLAAVVVIGGDGTVRSVAERLNVLARMKLGAGGTGEIETPPMLIVPLGTANLLGRHLGIAWNDALLEEQVLSALRGGKIVHLDVARANDRLFLLMAGIGFDAAVVHELSRVRRGPISYFSYLEPAARIASSYAFPPIRVEVDGQQIFGPAPGVVFVGNVPEYGTGFPMLPLARADDGVLDICCMPCANLLEGAQMFLSAAAGEHLQQEGVVYMKGRRATIESPTGRKVPVQIDGDAAGYLPLVVEMLPVRLGLIVPE